MSQTSTITVTNSNNIQRAQNAYNVADTIQRAVNNIENIDPETRELLIKYMNDSYNNKNSIDYEITHHIEDNRSILSKLSETMSHQQLKLAFNEIIHALTISGYGSYGNAKMIKKMGELLALKDIKIDSLLDENDKLHKIIKKADEQSKINAIKTRDECTRSREILEKKIKDKPPSITDLMNQFWAK